MSLKKIVSTIATKNLSVGERVTFVNPGEAGCWEANSLSLGKKYVVQEIMKSFDNNIHYEFIKLEGIMGSFFSHAFKKV